MALGPVNTKEPLNNSFADRVADPIAMIARKSVQVVAVATMPNWLTQ